ncbi:MAG: hypothetical protein AB8B55_19130 [Mariniblastus sp.]
MRSNNISSSIANVITRFSVQATAMLRAINAPQQQWHLNLCTGPFTDWHLGTDLLFLDLGTGIDGYSPSGSEPRMPSVKQPSKPVHIRQTFQRLS